MNKLIYCIALMLFSSSALGQGPVKAQNPTLKVSEGIYQTTPVDSSGSSQVAIQLKFTEAGAGFSGCVAQVLTAYDGAAYLKLGKAVPITISAGGIQAWTVTEMTPVPGVVTVTTPSSTEAKSFGTHLKIAINCGTFGKEIPKTTVSLIFT